MAILIQPRDLRAMVRGWTPGMTPRYNSLPRQKKFRHDNTDPLSNGNDHGYILIMNRPLFKLLSF